jgi:hypothetical protein
MEDLDTKQQNVSAWNKCPDVQQADAWTIAKLADKAVLDGKSSDEFMIECASKGISSSSESLSSAYRFAEAMRKIPMLHSMFKTVMNQCEIADAG